MHCGRAQPCPTHVHFEDVRTKQDIIRVSSRIFCLGGKIVYKYQLCVKHAKFLSPFLSINHQCTKKHKARVFIIRYCIN